MTSRLVGRNAPVLMTLANLGETARSTILSAAKKEIIVALVECARAIINRQVPLTPSQSRAVRQSARSILHLVRPGLTTDQQRRVLQRGGFIGLLLKPLLGLLGGLVGGGLRR